MERQTALRPKRLPGQEPPGGRSGPGDPAPRPCAVHPRGGRPTTLLSGLLAGIVLVLSGVGLGAAGTTVIGTGALAELRRQAEPGTRTAPTGQPAEEGRPGRAGESARRGPGADAGRGAAARPSAPPLPLSGASSRPVRATLGLEAVDARKAGARIVAVHVPGPGYTAGLVRGDVLVRFDGVGIDSATDLAHAVDAARPGRAAHLTVCHRDGACRALTVTPGVVT
ncbi:PDZ domain-containing protein [Streptomyces sp. NPDC048481]|uniref:PDZ domain-containing protein n=1 Tax=Streptomyces sp. NPDC048481 TaxID=3365557 RepID=UPI00371DE154